MQKTAIKRNNTSEILLKNDYTQTIHAFIVFDDAKLNALCHFVTKDDGCRGYVDPDGKNPLLPILVGGAYIASTPAGQQIINKSLVFLSDPNKVQRTIQAATLGAELVKLAFFSDKVPLHEGQQGKHIVGHNNYVPELNRSILTHKNPQELLNKFAGKGQPLNGKKFGEPGYRERVDFGTEIGIHMDHGINMGPTTKGTIHYRKDGAHIVPSASDSSIDSGGFDWTFGLFK